MEDENDLVQKRVKVLRKLQGENRALQKTAEAQSDIIDKQKAKIEALEAEKAELQRAIDDKEEDFEVFRQAYADCLAGCANYQTRAASIKAFMRFLQRVVPLSKKEIDGFERIKDDTVDHEALAEQLKDQPSVLRALMQKKPERFKHFRALIKKITK